MDSLRTVSGTGTTLVMPANQNTWFAVAAVTSNGRPGERCIAIEKGTTLTGCIVQKDASVVAISSPAQGQYPSCQPTGSMAVRFVWKNSGLDTLYQVPFAYRLNNATPTLQTFNGVYPPGFQSTFTFGVPANASAVGTYTLSIYAQLSGDQNRYNDTVRMFSRWFRRAPLLCFRTCKTLTVFPTAQQRAIAQPRYVRWVAG
jgi:hypothetical protein